jgi:hypothetical protein
MQATRERRQPRSRRPLPAHLGPRRDRLRVGPGLAAQPGGLAGQRLIVTALRRALEDPRDLGEQVRAPAGELAGWRVTHSPPGALRKSPCRGFVLETC